MNNRFQNRGIMNQDQVKELLLKLDSRVEDFTVILSGKKSNKVDGLYYPERKEIIIHNHNFTEDSPLIYTAIHEFAHHLHHTRSTVPISTRAHNSKFWEILHKLLFDAEEKGLYSNIFKKDSRFLELTHKIREKYLAANGTLMKELGQLLMKAHELCEEHGACFDDYVDRELLLHRTAARTLMKVHSYGIRPEIGYENMKTVAAIKDESFRSKAEEAFAEGKTPDMVRTEFGVRNRSGSGLDTLMHERDRIERSIDTLTRKLAKIERQINELKYEERPRGAK